MGKHEEEELARACIEQTIGVPVGVHDDGSQPRPGLGMYDLEIRHPGRPVVPVEVSSDVHGAAAGSLNTLAKRFRNGVWPAPRLTRAWELHTDSAPPLKRLHGQVEDLLAVLEAADITSLDPSTAQVRQIARLMNGTSDSIVAAETALLSMGVQRALSFAPDPDGPVIRLHLELGRGGWDGTADAVVAWIERFMVDPDRQDNLRKLAAAAQGEAHLAVYADMTGADWEVWRALWDRTETGVVPTVAPTLTPPVTHLWLFAKPRGRTGLGWDPRRGWYRFSCIPRAEASVPPLQ